MTVITIFTIITVYVLFEQVIAMLVRQGVAYHFVQDFLGALIY